MGSFRGLLGVCQRSVEGSWGPSGVWCRSGEGPLGVHQWTIIGEASMHYFSIPTIGNVACFSKDGERTQSAEVKCLDGPFAPETESFHSSTHYLH